MYIDNTDAFRGLIAAGSSSSATSSRPSSPRPRALKQQHPDDGFLKEAYQIHGHLADLARMLQTIRKAYLSTSEPPLARRNRRQQTEGGDGDADLGRFEGVTYLSDRERDEIDVRAKMILRRCRERVGLLEEQEKLRKQKVAQATPAIYQFFPSLVTAPDNTESFLTAHRASVIWTLTNELARLSAQQADLQEERAKRREERMRTLGGGAEREAQQMRIGGPSSSAPTSTFTTSMGLPPMGVIPDDEPPIEAQLSAAQLQQFESENNALLDHMQAQLDSVLSAEKSLLEISNLQTELVRHLAMQTEITDRLYDEAIGSVAEMGKANMQLKQAKERSGEARLFLLIFLFGASMALLFLNWYA